MFATSLADFNTILNVLMLAGLVLAGAVFAPRAWRAAEAKAREEEMQRTITAYKGRVEALEPHVESLTEEIQDCRAEATRWEARYQEQSKYTAEAALTSVLAELVQTRKVFETSMHALGELMTEHSRLVARALDRLEK
jgi:predicted RNase H-like nuclease (RuvC/YqgF family)